MLCLSVVCVKRKGNFRWIEMVISLLVLSLTFQLKANDLVWTNFYLFYFVYCVYIISSICS